MTAKLPTEFADLEPFSAWALPGETARYNKRLSSSMDEMQAFYDAALPRLEAGMKYLDQFELDALPNDATYLMFLFEALITASFPVEVWHQPRVPDSGAAEVNATFEPAV